MEDQSNEVRVQVPLSRETVAKLDELAERMKVGRGRMAAILLEEGITDTEWIIRVVTSQVMQPVTEAVRRWTRTRAKPAKARGAGQEGA